MSRKVKTFKAPIEDKASGKMVEVELAIMKPDTTMNAKARIQQSKAFRDAMDAGAPLRAKLDQYIRGQGLWTDELEARVIELGSKITECEDVLSKGGCKLTEAYRAAIDLRRARNEVALLMADRNNLDAYTCEGQGENARFESLVSQAIVNNETGKPIFKSHEDYLDRSEEEVAQISARLFADLFYGVKDDYYRNLPENKFLLKFNYCNEDLHLIDKQGRLIDTMGRLVDKNGNLIDEDGNFVDDSGNKIDKYGQTTIEQEPFLDDDGNPIGDDGKPIEQKVEEPQTTSPAKISIKKKSAARKKKVATTKTE